jgi:hypothetical protein
MNSSIVTEKELSFSNLNGNGVQLLWEQLKKHDNLEEKKIKN